MNDLIEGIPCDHIGCLSHVTHPCEGCGRVGGRIDEYIPDVGTFQTVTNSVTQPLPKWGQPSTTVQEEKL